MVSFCNEKIIVWGPFQLPVKPLLLSREFPGAPLASVSGPCLDSSFLRRGSGMIIYGLCLSDLLFLASILYKEELILTKRKESLP